MQMYPHWQHGLEHLGEVGLTDCYLEGRFGKKSAGQDGVDYHFDQVAVVMQWRVGVGMGSGSEIDCYEEGVETDWVAGTAESVGLDLDLWSCWIQREKK